MLILNKDYDGESLADVSRDVMESFNPLFNDKIKGIPKGSYGFIKGTFKVQIIWEDDCE